MIKANVLKGGLREKNVLKKNNASDEPLISIITPVLNNEKYIQECLNSLHGQIYTNYEHIIIDGGSSDKTLEIIKTNEEKIDFWTSKKDKGIYDAFNEGMNYAKGDIIGFLNSDDSYYSDKTLNYVVRAFKENKDIDFIFGPVKKHWGLLHGYKPWKIHFTWGFYSSHSTGFFIKTESAKKVGLYNLKYKYSSDYDYFFRMIVGHKMKGVSTKKNELFGTFRRGGFSSTIKFFDHFLEEIKIRLDNNQNRFLVLCIFIYKFIKNIGKI